MKIEFECSHHTFLTAAASASWFNDSFDYRTVAKWCAISEEQGKAVLDALLKSGHVQVNAERRTILTESGKAAVRKAA